MLPSSINHTPQKNPTFHEHIIKIGILCFNFRPHASTKSEYFKRLAAVLHEKLTSSKFQLPLSLEEVGMPYHISTCMCSPPVFFGTRALFHLPNTTNSEFRAWCAEESYNGKKNGKKENVIRISNWQANICVCVCARAEIVGPYSPRFTFNIPSHHPTQPQQLTSPEWDDPLNQHVGVSIDRHTHIHTCGDTYWKTNFEAIVWKFANSSVSTHDWIFPFSTKRSPCGRENRQLFAGCHLHTHTRFPVF